MDIIEQIGSYAGLAAIVGLAVMSALYFSQARDVKRLREWAGRAPERADAAATQTPRVVAKPVPKPPGAQAPATPAAGAKQQPPEAAPAPVPQTAGAQAVAAQAAGTGAAPAVATGPAAATPAAARAAGGTGVEEPAAPPAEGTNGTEEHAVISQDTVVHPAPGHGPGAPDAPDDDEQPTSVDDAPGDESEGGDEALAGASDGAGEEAPGASEAGAMAAAEAAGAQEPSAEVPAIDEDSPERDAEIESDDAGPASPEAGAPDDLPDPESFHEGGDEAPGPPPATPAATPPAPPRRPTIPIGGTPRAQAREPRQPILPPYSQSRPGGAPLEPAKREGLFSSRRRALAVLGGTVLGIAVLAFGVQQLTGEDEGGSKPKSAGGSGEQSDKPARSQKAAIDPSKVTVAVLNGTTVPGLARQIGDTIEQQGFQLGTVTNFIDQQRAESVVLYAPGAEREAADVGRRLKIAQREAIDAESQGQAGDATVVVVAGADKTQ